MTNTSFDWQIDEFMVNCRSRQLRAKTLASYEQTLRLFERWCKEQMKIEDESVSGLGPFRTSVSFPAVSGFP